MLVTPRACSSSTSRTPRRCPRSGARSSRAATPGWPSRCPALPGCWRRCATENGAPAAAGASDAARRGCPPAPEPPAEVPRPAPLRRLRSPKPRPQPSGSPPDTDERSLGAVAAATALVKAYRTHGHLAARLDPLGSEPVGDPALEPERLIPKLTPELQAQIPAVGASSRLRGRDARRRSAQARRDLLRDDRL